jgi:cytochrome c-type biogenesis protein CcmH/NrfG
MPTPSQHSSARRARPSSPHATAVVAAGLALAPDDPVLIASRGEAKAGMGDPEGALADWRHAVELNPEDIGPLYSSAFLFERQDRLGDAAAVWSEIIDGNESRRLRAAIRVAEARTRATSTTPRETGSRAGAAGRS